MGARETGTSRRDTFTSAGGDSPVLGAILTDLDFSSENEFATGVVDWAEARDVTVILLPGGTLHSHSPRNTIFHLAGETWLDGLMISPFLRHLVPMAEMRRFCERFAPLPVVLGATGLEGVPHVRVDSFSGMRDIVTHLIEAHHLERIVFITGPDGDREAEERYRAYEAALHGHNLAVDPDLVVPGNFMEESGASAVQGLLDANVSFDAVVGANDAMAAGAYWALQDYGLNVPGDIAVAGFDDAPDVQSSLSLTTARQSFYELAHQVGDRLMDLVAGRSAPAQTMVPASLVVRRSCGCLPDHVVQAAVGSKVRAGDTDRRAPLEVRYKPESVPLELWQAFTQDMRSTETDRASGEDGSSAKTLRSPAFLGVLECQMRQAHDRGAIDEYQQMLNAIRRAVLPFLGEKDAVIRADDLLEQARVLIAETAERRAHAMLQHIQEQASLLRAFDVELSSAQDLGSLASAIQRSLPPLGIHRCYLVRWMGKVQERAQLLLVVDDQHAEVMGRTFSVARCVIPDGVAYNELEGAIVALPLTLENDVLGYAVINWGPRDGVAYRRIEARFSSVLNRLHLLEEADLARRRAEETLEEVVTTRSIADRLQRAVDTEAVLRITLEELSEVLGTSTSVARLGTREQLLEDQDGEGP